MNTAAPCQTAVLANSSAQVLWTGAEIASTRAAERCLEKTLFVCSFMELAAPRTGAAERSTRPMRRVQTPVQASRHVPGPGCAQPSTGVRTSRNSSQTQAFHAAARNAIRGRSAMATQPVSQS